LIDIYKNQNQIIARFGCIIKVDEITVVGMNGSKPVFQVKLSVDVQNGKPEQIRILSEKSFLTIQESHDITKNLEGLS